MSKTDNQTAGAGKSFRKTPAILLLLASCVVAYQLGVTWRRRTAESPLAVPAADLELGDVWETDEYQKTLTVINRGGEDIDIMELASSCGCVQVEPRSLVIPAGERKQVRLKLDLNWRSRREWGQPVRSLEVRVAPIVRPKSSSEGPTVLSGWVLRGWIKSRVTLEPPQADFWPECIRGRKTARVTVAAKVHVPFTRIEVPVDPARATVRVSRVAGDGKTFRLEVTPSDQLPAGEFHLALPVMVETAEGRGAVGAVLSVNGEMQEAILAAPKTIWFGPARLGTTVSGTVTLISADGKQEPEVIGYDVSEEGLTIQGEAVEVKGGKAFKLNQKIACEGEQCVTARFKVRQQHANTIITIPVECHYYGLQEEGGNGSGGVGKVGIKTP